jgi:hypothetical protein
MRAHGVDEPSRVRWPPGAIEEGGAAGWYDVEADRDYLVGVTMADVGDVAVADLLSAGRLPVQR